MIGQHLQINERKISGTGDLTATLDNAAAVDQGNGIVRIPATAHAFAVGSHVYIEGTTSYDGLFELQAVAANTFDIKALFVAETFAGTETAAFVITATRKWEMVGFGWAATVAPNTAQNIVFTVDNADGASFDFILTDLTQDLDGLVGFSGVLTDDKRLPLNAGDIVRVTWANTQGRTYGLKVYFQEI